MCGKCSNAIGNIVLLSNGIYIKMFASVCLEFPRVFSVLQVLRAFCESLLGIYGRWAKAAERILFHHFNGVHSDFQLLKLVKHSNSILINESFAIIMYRNLSMNDNSASAI